ncbi:MAG TPA: ECF-type sigma factor [Gemmatimonadaceae bacterium]
MTPESETTVTRLLGELQRGQREALDQLYPLVYEELKALAHYHRRRWHGDDTLGTTALLHEAYLKLAGQRQLTANSRAHFFAVAAKAMRHILSNYAEARRRKKRGGDRAQVSLEVLEAMPVRLDLSDDHADMLSALDEALAKLEATNERLSRVVECRFFGGMSIADTAAALEISPATVKRGWLLARAWLYRELSG